MIDESNDIRRPAARPSSSSSGGASASGGHKRGGVNEYDGEAEATLEAQNDAVAALLEGKVAQMRSLSLDIGTRINTDNRFLETEVDGGMDDSRTLLRRITGRVDTMLESGGWRQMCYIAVFFVFVVVILWKIVL